MKFGVVIFPGSNCDQDLIQTLQRISGKKNVVELWHRDMDLQGCDVVFLPGGFSYGDYLRSGAIAKLSPVMGSVIAFAEKGGTVVGICNGFQILCESGLLPGALLRNSGQLFICQNQFVRTESINNQLTHKFNTGEVLNFPIAHAEGRYYADASALEELEDNDQIIFRYCNSDGILTESANPNGSANHIAGICNKGRNVFGMMPHPERAADPLLLNTDGIRLFESIMHGMVLS